MIFVFYSLYPPKPQNVLHRIKMAVAAPRSLYRYIPFHLAKYHFYIILFSKWYSISSLWLRSRRSGYKILIDNNFQTLFLAPSQPVSRWARGHGLFWSTTLTTSRKKTHMKRCHMLHKDDKKGLYNSLDEVPCRETEEASDMMKHFSIGDNFHLWNLSFLEAAFVCLRLEKESCGVSSRILLQTLIKLVERYSCILKPSKYGWIWI